MKRGQKGFTVVETLLVLILLAILGFTGYYVYHTQKNTSSTYNNSAAISANTPTAIANKFDFKELGVQIILPNELKGLAYTVSNDNGVTSLGLYTPKSTEAIHACDSSVDTGIFTSITKHNGQYDSSSDSLSYNLKQFNGFWIGAVSAIGGLTCSSNSDNLQTVVSQSNSALSDAFKNATEIKQ